MTRWNVVRWNRCAWISASSGPGTGTGRRSPPPTTCTGMHPAQRITTASTDKARAAAHTAPPALAFFFCPSSTPAALLPGLPDQWRPDDRAACPMTTPAHHHRSRSPRPPAPPASSRPPAAPAPHRCTRSPSAAPPAHCLHPAHLPDLTAAASSQRPPPAPISSSAAPAATAADQRHSGPKMTGRGPMPEGSDSLPHRHIDLAV